MTTASTAGTTIGPLGVTVLASTSTGGPVEMTLATPKVGYEKTLLVRTIGSTSSFFYIDMPTSDTTILGTTADRIALNTTGDALTLFGYTTSLWLVKARSSTATVAFSTST